MSGSGMLCARSRTQMSCFYACPHGVPVRHGMLIQKEPECYARYRQGLAPVAEERKLQTFVSVSACQMPDEAEHKAPHA